MIEDLSIEDIHHAVDRLVEETLSQAGAQSPPVDAVELARRCAGSDTARGLRGRRPATRGEELTQEQRQWLAAQKLGQHYKAILLRRLGLPVEAQALGGPSLVNLLATAFLLPRQWFADDARALEYDVLALAQRYQTAGAVRVALRLLDLDEPCIMSIVEDERIVQRRSNAWRVRRELRPPERACQRNVHQYSRPYRVRSDGWTVQGWPLHQPNRKREILRSVPPEEFAS